MADRRGERRRTLAAIVVPTASIRVEEGEASLRNIPERLVGKRRGKDEKFEGELVDLNTGVLRRDHVLIERTRGVELFIGFGPVAGRALDFAFEREFEPNSFLAYCDAVDQALACGAFTKANQAHVGAQLTDLSEPYLRRLALLEAMLAKASPDDPVRPGWPAGTSGGLGGKFRPKETSAEAKESTEQALRRLEARRQFRILASAVLLVAIAAPLNAIPGVGEAADIETLIALGHTAIELGNAAAEVNAAIDFVKKGPYTLDELRVSAEDQSFSSFSAFKKTSLIEALLKAFGSADAGSEYHHIVEQGGDNDTNIPPALLHSTNNVIELPKLLHELVNAEYSTVDGNTGQTFRDWVQTQPFEVQRAEGIKVLQELGIVKP